MPKIPKRRNAHNLPRPELIIGLVGAVGSNLEEVVRILEEEFRAYKYNCHEIKLSSLLKSYAPQFNIKCPPGGEHEESRLNCLMDAGNSLRKITECSDVLSMLAINSIRSYRKERNTHVKIPEEAMRSPLDSQVYILKSLKHPTELNKLREIYRDNFFLISLFSPQEKREARLLDKIKMSHHDARESSDYRDKAHQLIKKDTKEEGIDHGQNVSDIFPLADFFIQEEADPERLASQIRRFLKLLFGFPFITPTIDEYCMFSATAAALRSADLSRQVGAIIATNEGEFIAAGCNEVPKAGGGAFWDGKDSPISDYRDYKREVDSNAAFKEDNVIEIFKILKENKLLSGKYANLSPEELARKSLFDSDNPFLKSSGIANVLEYGRIVHAEMTAITEAARRGIAVKDAILYCTTFPCHICARHILACGISQVIYIEPYPKSLTKALYERAVQIDDGKAADKNALRFQPFVGIAPRIYSIFFKMTKRKEKSGDIIKWKPETAYPRLRVLKDTYSDIEMSETVIFKQKIDLMRKKRTTGIKRKSTKRG